MFKGNQKHVALCASLGTYHLTSSALIELIKINIILISSVLWNYLSIIFMKRWIVFSIIIIGKSSHFASCFALFSLPNLLLSIACWKAWLFLTSQNLNVLCNKTSADMDKQNVWRKVNFLQKTNFLQRNVYVFVCIFAHGELEVNPFPPNGVSHWCVKSSGVRRSKIYKCQLALTEGKG